MKRWTDIEEYFMEEACAIFAIALHVLNPSLKLFLITGKQGIHATVYAHVFCGVDEEFGVDVLGIRPVRKMVDFYWDLNRKKIVPVTLQELKFLCGNQDRKPFTAASKANIDEALSVIRANPSKYGIELSGF